MALPPGAGAPVLPRSILLWLLHAQTVRVLSSLTSPVGDLLLQPGSWHCQGSRLPISCGTAFGQSLLLDALVTHHHSPRTLCPSDGDGTASWGELGSPWPWECRSALPEEGKKRGKGSVHLCSYIQPRKTQLTNFYNGTTIWDKFWVCSLLTVIFLTLSCRGFRVCFLGMYPWLQCPFVYDL